MAKDSGGGGAFAWTLLGFLAGIAATLGVQTLMGGAAERPPADAAPASGQVHITTAPSSAAPEPVRPEKKRAALADAAPSAAPAVRSAAAVAAPSPEVADDAAAAGMTSRLTPGGDAANN